MTPFGTLIRFMREERGLTQHEMGRRLQLDSKAVSALETGRRRPPDIQLLEKIIEQLKLSESEASQLLNAAQHSSYVVRIPREISPKNLRLIHQFVTTLDGLRPDQISVIQKVIEGGS